MSDLTVDAADVAPVRFNDNGKHTGPTSAVVTAGQWVRMDTNGKWTPGRANTQANAGGLNGLRGIAIQNADPAGEAISVISDGLVDLGTALDGMNVGDPVYGSDTASGVLGTTAGTSSVLIGRVYGNYGATTVQKLLQVLPNQEAAAVV
jgi:hypothetical protein